MLAIDAENPKAWESIGLVELRLGHWPQARDASRKALARRAGLAQAWNNLGVALFQLGDIKGALEAWSEAVERRPDFWDALWNPRLKAANHGRPDLARPALARFAADAPGGSTPRTAPAPARPRGSPKGRVKPGGAAAVAWPVSSSPAAPRRRAGGGCRTPVVLISIGHPALRPPAAYRYRGVEPSIARCAATACSRALHGDPAHLPATPRS